MSVPTLNDYEYQLGDDGVLINGDVALPFIDVTTVQGLDSAPIRLSQADHEGIDGGYVDSEFETTRTVVIEGTLYADINAVDLYTDQLKFNWAPTRTSLPFYFKHPSVDTRVVYGKPQGAKYDITTLRRTGTSEIQLQLLCADPYIYTAQHASFSTFVSANIGDGFAFPFSFPFSFGSGNIGSNGQVIIPNGSIGNRRNYPNLYIYGPCNNPIIVNQTLGKQLSFNIQIDAGDYLLIDLRYHRVLLNGSQSKRDAMSSSPSSWWWLEPNIDNTLMFFGSSSDPTNCFMTVNVFGAWR